LPTAGVLDLQVREGLRRQGLGRYLLTMLLRHLQEQQAAAVEIQVSERNTAAVNLLRGLAFDQVDIGRAFRPERTRSYFQVASCPPLAALPRPIQLGKFFNLQPATCNLQPRSMRIRIRTFLSRFGYELAAFLEGQGFGPVEVRTGPTETFEIRHRGGASG